MWGCEQISQLTVDSSILMDNTVLTLLIAKGNKVVQSVGIEQIQYPQEYPTPKRKDVGDDVRRTYAIVKRKSYQIKN